MTPDPAAELERIKAERNALSQELEGLRFVHMVIENPDARLCCDGRECGCRGSTIGQYAAWAMKPDPEPTTPTQADQAAAYKALHNEAQAAGFAAVGEWIAYLRDEIAEQARLNGMGSEREAALMGEIARLRGALAGVVDDEPCRFDHHGYCQAHFITDPCEMAIARAALGERQPC